MRKEEELTILIVTHLLQEVAEHADQVLLVQGGRVGVLDTRQEIESHLYAAVGASRRLGEEASASP